MTDKTMKLYQYAGSPNSRRVRIFLAEKGLSIPLIPIDLSNGTTILYNSTACLCQIGRA
jgi:glutathione S-transferase